MYAMLAVLFMWAVDDIFLIKKLEARIEAIENLQKGNKVE